VLEQLCNLLKLINLKQIIINKSLLLSCMFISTIFIPTINFGQSVNLGSAANFVLFTTVGEVTNTGISQLTGNVGTNNGSSTGFGNVNGVMHDNDGATAQAGADLLTAYANANTAIPDFYPASLLGNGDTLIAGVYHIASVATLNGTLYLDGKGDVNAKFIIQIQGAFSTAAASKVRMINGVKSCNIYWKVEGLISMAPATYMSGTIIANNAAINMNTNDTLNGRALSIAGAISTDGVLAYLPNNCGVFNGPALPALGSTIYYGLFSADGPVNNTGVSNITGSIGTNVGLTVGFDSTKVSCKIHPIADTSTAKCAADLLVLYTYLNVLPYDIELLYLAQFGRGLVLTPHTYILKGATTFTDTLYLNAVGNPNAVFVIKINGALSTSTYSKVLLINGAQAKNVFWKIEGAVDINDYSVFVGTIVANNGAINLRTGVQLNGQAFTTTGALTTAAITVLMPVPVCEGLPVKWMYVRALAANNSVLLQWATSSELNNKYFSIQKSNDGQSFKTIGTVSIAENTLYGEQYYSYNDVTPANINYYRIAQTDMDGSISYSTIVSIHMSADLKVTQCVQRGNIVITVAGANAGLANIKLISTDGRIIAVNKVNIAAGFNQYKINKPSKRRLYILTIESMGQRLYSGKVMIL